MPGPIMAPNLAQNAAQLQLQLAAANVPPGIRDAIQSYYGATQITVTDQQYWSTVRFQGVRAAGPPVTFTIDTSERLAFSYARGMPLTAAGFPASYGNATVAETNLLQQSQTRDNSDFWLWGIGMYFTQDSEPTLARRVARETSVWISLNGSTNIPIGTPDRFPAGGGLYGAGQSFIKEPAINVAGGVDNGQGALYSFWGNGNPVAQNFRKFQQPWLWSGIGTAGSDSSLTITFRPERQIVESCAAARPATAGVLAYTPPAATGDLGTFVDVRVYLYGIEVKKRSRNT